MMNTSLEVIESANSDVSTVNDFRKIVLLRDPTKSASAVTSNTARLTKQLELQIANSSRAFAVDEEINQQVQRLLKL